MMRECNYVWNNNNINNIIIIIIIIPIIIIIIIISNYNHIRGIKYTYLALNQLLLPACDIHYAIHETIREIYANAEI
jgi:hypothetical protein